MGSGDERKVAGYARVSTDSQDLEQQVLALRRYSEYKGFELVRVYQDVGSGKSWTNRPEFAALIEDLRALKYDGVVVFRLDRLFRNVVEAVNFIQEWDKRGIQIHSINENLDTSTAIGRAMRDIILVLAQLERENISEATKARLAVLKDSGKKLGRPEISKFQIDKINRMRSEGYSIREISGQMQIGKSTVHKYLKEK